MGAYPSHPKLVLRKRAGTAIWYIQCGATRRSTGFREEERSAAEQFLRTVKVSNLSGSLFGSHPSEILIDIVCSEALSNAEQRCKKGEIDSTNLSRRANEIRNLEPFWKDMSMDEFNQDNVDQYMVERCNGLGNYLGRDPVGRQTAFSEILILRALLHKFADTHDIEFRARIKKLSFPTAEQHLLSRSDLHRILLACRGYIWSEKDDRMVGRPGNKSGVQIKASRKHLARMIIIVAYTGSRGSCVRNLAWMPSAENNQSYIDISHEPPLLYRLGPDIGPGKMRGTPVYLGRRITNHLRIWHEKDSRDSKKYIISPEYSEGGKVGKYFAGIKSVMIDAGLPAVVGLDDIRYSAMFHLAETRVSSFAIGILTGTKASDFLLKFGVVRPNYQEEINEAFLNMRSSKLNMM